MNILLDVSPPPFTAIHVINGGRLVWGDRDGLALTAGEIIVDAQGSFWMGSQDCLFTHSAKIVIAGDSYTNIAEFSDIIVRGAEGFLEIHSVTATVSRSSRMVKTTAATAATAASNGTYISGEDKIPSNFNITQQLVPAWGTGGIPGTGRPDVVGAFRFICNPSHEAYDDPIVFNGKPGASHLHQFFGNTLVDAYSTYKSLRTTGNSTCASALNRSAYWIPAMLNGHGGLVRPDYVSVYYKRIPQTDPNCKVEGRDCVRVPRGLRYVFGFDMINGTAATGGGYFNCQGPNATSGHYASLTEVGPFCPPGSQLGVVISAPSCWDGQNLDSPNHRSHVAYPGYGSWGYLKCPDTHPWVMPTFTLGVWYTVDSTLDMSGKFDNSSYTAPYTSWHLSSDEQYSGVLKQKMTPGVTLHSDWFGAWDDTVLQMWEDNCIDKLLTCNGGDLGNGLQLKEYANFTWTANPRIVPIPADPKAAATTATGASSATGASATGTTATGASVTGTSATTGKPANAKSGSAAVATSFLVVLALTLLAMF